MSVQYAPGDRWRRVHDLSLARQQRTQRYTDDLARTLTTQLHRLSRDQQLVVEEISRAQNRMRKKFQYIFDRQEQLRRIELRKQRLAAKRAKMEMRLYRQARKKPIRHPPAELQVLKESCREAVVMMKDEYEHVVDSSDEQIAKVTVLVENIAIKMATVVVDDSNLSTTSQIKVRTATPTLEVQKRPETSLVQREAAPGIQGKPTPVMQRDATLPRELSRVTSSRFRSVQTPPPSSPDKAASYVENAQKAKRRPSTATSTRLRLTHAK